MDSLTVRFIVEILGKPAEHVKETMRSLITKLGEEKGVSLVHHTIHEPRPVEGSKELFTTFAELEARFDSIHAFLGIIFAYMPSNIEVISPSSLKMTNEEITTLGNLLIGRLHLYESVTKKLVGDRDILINKLKSMGVTFQQSPPVGQSPQPVKENKESKKSGKKKSKKR